MGKLRRIKIHDDWDKTFLFKAIDVHIGWREGWVRMFGYGFKWKDYTVYPMVYSQRYGKKLIIGNYYFGWLKK